MLTVLVMQIADSASHFRKRFLQSEILIIVIYSNNLLRPEGDSKAKKCPILIFQYVIELGKTNKKQKTRG